MSKKKEVITGFVVEQPDSIAYREVLGELRERQYGLNGSIISIFPKDVHIPESALSVETGIGLDTSSEPSTKIDKDVSHHLREFDIRFQLKVASRVLVDKSRVRTLSKLLKAA